MDKLKSMLYRLLAILLVVTMVSGNFSGLTLVAEAEELSVLTGEITTQIDEEAFPSNEELAMGYVENVLYSDLQNEVMPLGEVGAENLANDTEKAIYAAVKEQIQKIAAGEVSSSIIQLSDLVSLTWTAEELGILDYVNVSDAELKTAVGTKLASSVNFDNIISYLLMDCPYDLYWYDKTKTGGTKIQYSIGADSETGTWAKATVSNITFRMMVAEEYQDEAAGYDENLQLDLSAYTVDNALAKGASTAKTKASEIVVANASKSDYEKLKAYKDEICNLTSYNDEAAADSTTAYGNPWQLIWVFDDEASTEVVCEGYSKAFQYLCDLSGISCYTVIGDLIHGTKEGPHMWNIVPFEGANYLVDVTNCDEGNVGAPDKLFLAGTTGSVAEGYSFTLSDSSSTITKFVYDEDDENQVALFGEALLTLADTNYVPKEIVEVTNEVSASLTSNELVCSYDEESDNRETAGTLNVTVSYSLPGEYDPEYVIKNSLGETVAEATLVSNTEAGYTISINYAEYSEGTYTLQISCPYFNGKENVIAYAEPIEFQVIKEKRDYPINKTVSISKEKKEEVIITFGDILDELKEALLNGVTVITDAGEAIKEGSIAIQTLEGTAVTNETELETGEYQIIYSLNDAGEYFNPTVKAQLSISYETVEPIDPPAPPEPEKPPVTYGITYNLNGGVNNVANPMNYTEGAVIQFVNPTRSGYDFQGWYSDSTLTKKVTGIDAGSTGDKSVYAKWIKSYTITYSLKGGTNSSSNPQTYNKTTATITLKKPTRKGYTFQGWYSDSKYKTKVSKISQGSTGNKKLYAKWEKTKYTVTYSLNKGKNSSSNPKSYYVTSKTIKLKKPTRKGYTFKGWYTEKSYTNKISKISEGSAGNLKLYAKWEKTKYTITYNLKGGTNSSSNPANYYITTSTIKLKNPKQKGYTFKGWYSDSKYKTKVTKISKGSTGNKKLYAKWEKVKYTITYDAKGGKNSSSNPKSYYVTTSTITLKKPTRKGYTFGGWYKDSKYKTKITSIPKGSTGSLKLYAKWTANKYAIHFDTNGGIGTVNDIASCTVGKSYMLPICDYVREGYYFKEWNTKASGKGKSYKNLAKVKNVTYTNGKTVTLYAIWGKFSSSELKKANQVLAIVNKERKKHGLAEVTTDSTLTAIAQQRAKESAVYWSHTRPDEKSSCFSLYTGAGYRDGYEKDGLYYMHGAGGENIAYTYQGTAAEVMELWMNSPGHRANILNESFAKLGIGCYYADGRYYWVQNFSD